VANSRDAGPKDRAGRERFAFMTGEP
jgi:hypothetical protein